MASIFEQLRKTFSGKKRSDRQFYLHVGGHKTGSSAQQVWFARNTDLMARAGLAYPTEITGGGGNCMYITEVWTKSPESWNLKDQVLIAEVSAFMEQSRDLDVLMSSENFNRPEYLPGLKHIARDLQNLGLPCTALMVVRNQVDHLSSYYAQRHKFLDMTLPFGMEALALERMNMSDWNLRRELHLSLGFRSRVGVFQRKRPMGIVEALFDLAGLTDRFPKDTDFSIEEINPALGELGVLTGMHIARHLDHLASGMPIGGRIAYRECVVPASKAIGDRPFIGPNAEERALIRARYAEGNRALAKVLPEDEAELLLTERLPEGPVSPRSVGELDPARFALLEALFEDTRTRMLNSANLLRYLSPEQIRAIPRIVS
jgi:hypothetical protein